MATQFKKDDVVRLKGVIPAGPVQKIRMSEDGNVEYLITWVDADEQTQERWFAEASLEAVGGV